MGTSETSNNEGVVVVVACMDRRLVGLLKLFDDNTMTLEQKYEKLTELFKNHGEVYEKVRKLLGEIQGRNVIILTNAAGNVKGLENTLKEIKERYGINMIINVTHDTCGGAATIATELFNRKTEDNDPMFRHLGGSEYSSAYKDGMGVKEIRLGVEAMNLGIQVRRAAEWSNNVDGVQVKVGELNLREEGADHWLVLASYGIGTYSKNFANTPNDRTYCIVARRMDSKEDIQIARTIGMSITVDNRRKKVR